MPRFALQLPHQHTAVIEDQQAYAMSTRHEATLHVLQAEFAQPQPPVRDTLILFRIRRRIPRINVVHSEPDRLNLLTSPARCQSFGTQTRCRCTYFGARGGEAERLLQDRVS